MAEAAMLLKVLRKINAETNGMLAVPRPGCMHIAILPNIAPTGTMLTFISAVINNIIIEIN